MLSYLYTLLHNSLWFAYPFSLELRPETRTETSSLELTDMDENQCRVIARGKFLLCDWYEETDFTYIETYERPIVNIFQGDHALRVVLDDGSYQFYTFPEYESTLHPPDYDTRILDLRELLFEANATREELFGLGLPSRIEETYTRLEKQLIQLELEYQTHLSRSSTDKQEVPNATVTRIWHPSDREAILVMNSFQANELIRQLQSQINENVIDTIRIKLARTSN